MTTTTPTAPAAQTPAQTIAASIATFPTTFGLRAFRGDTFRLSARASYMAGPLSGGPGSYPMLYTQRLTESGEWLDFAKGTADELRRQVVDAPAPVAPPAPPAPVAPPARKLTTKQSAALVAIHLGLTGVYPHASTLASLRRRDLIVNHAAVAFSSREGVARVWSLLPGGETVCGEILARIDLTQLVRHMVHCTLENISESKPWTDTVYPMTETVTARVHSDVEFHCDDLSEYGLMPVLAPLGITDRFDVAKVGRVLTLKSGLAAEIVSEVMSLTSDQVAAEYRYTVRPAMDRHIAEGVAVTEEIVDELIAEEAKPRAAVATFALDGIQANPVVVEVVRTPNPSRAAHDAMSAGERELRVRVGSALREVGIPSGTGAEFLFHAGRSNRADLPAGGQERIAASFDLAAALALHSFRTGLAVPADVAFIGELSLGGNLRPVRGILPMVLAARDAGMRKVIVPLDNAAEAACVDGMDVRAAGTLGAVVDHLRDPSWVGGLQPLDHTPIVPAACESRIDDVVGQDAIDEIVAAVRAGKSVLMIGPPCSAKTMIARRLPSVLPLMTQAEAMEATAIFSAAGHLDAKHLPVITQRPFRAPHYTVSDAGILGGGPLNRPGEMALATHGVLFLDEVQEIRRSALDAVWNASDQPIIVASAVPCPCGSKLDLCRCTQEAKDRYSARLDSIACRFDVVVQVQPVSLATIKAAREERAEMDSMAEYFGVNIRRDAGEFVVETPDTETTRRFGSLDATRAALLAANVETGQDWEPETAGQPLA